MEVIFESCIKINNDGEWFIELRDPISAKVAHCHTIVEYSQAVEDFGKNYGGEIHEVVWNKDENVPPHAMDEIRLEMSKIQQELESEKNI